MALKTYFPSPPPGDESTTPADVAAWAESELQKVAESLQAFDLLRLVEQHAAPAKPRAGMIVLADGTDWNPGSGQGIYAYFGGSWHVLS